MTGSIKIIGSPMSQNVRKPIAVAYHLHIPIEIVPVPPHDAAVTVCNPSGRIPAMDDNGFMLGESNAIMIYLASKKHSSLYPDDPAGRARVHQWLSWDSAHWTPAYQPIQFERLVKQLLDMGPTDEAIVEKALVAFRREAALLERALAESDWLVGEEPTIADFSVGAGLTYAEPVGMPLDEFPAVQAWNARLGELEGWRKSMPEH
jgi:glutathione S-transferase